MKTNSWLKYEFTAEMRPKVAAPNDSILDEQYPPSGIIVNFTLRSNKTTTLEALAPTRLLLGSALVSITDRHGNTPFAIGGQSSQGDFWIVYHREPIYDMTGNIAYYLHKIRRES